MSPQTVVCLCGSACFEKHFQQAARQERHRGKIVLASNFNTAGDPHWLPSLPSDYQEDIKARLAEIQREKIRMADEVLFPNMEGDFTEPALQELRYAYDLGKRVRFSNPENMGSVSLIGAGSPQASLLHWYCSNCGAYQETTFGVSPKERRYSNGLCCVIGQGLHMTARCGICGQHTNDRAFLCSHLAEKL